jgi:hypothetical protein
LKISKIMNEVVWRVEKQNLSVNSQTLHNSCYHPLYSVTSRHCGPRHHHILFSELSITLKYHCVNIVTFIIPVSRSSQRSLNCQALLSFNIFFPSLLPAWNKFTNFSLPYGHHDTLLLLSSLNLSLSNPLSFWGISPEIHNFGWISEMSTPMFCWPKKTPHISRWISPEGLRFLPLVEFSSASWVSLPVLFPHWQFQFSTHLSLSLRGYVFYLKLWSTYLWPLYLQIFHVPPSVPSCLPTSFCEMLIDSLSSTRPSFLYSLLHLYSFSCFFSCFWSFWSCEQVQIALIK